MKKGNICKVLYGISIALLIGFAISLVTDYMKYNTYLNSAPFYVFVLVRAGELVLPSVIAFIVARVVKRKTKDV